MVPAEERADEWWLFWTSGAVGRAALVTGTGALLLLGGVVALRALLPEPGLPPWVAFARFGVAATVAMVGMIIVTRLTTSGSASTGAGTPAAAEPPLQLPHPTDTAVAPSAGAPLTRFQVETHAGKHVIAAADVEWIEACGNYARLHLSSRSFLYRMPLVRLERELDTSGFLRVHRSSIVNVHAIERVEPLPSGDADLRLRSGAQVRLSRRYAKTFHEQTGRAH